LAVPMKQKMSRQEMADLINNKEGGTWKATVNSRFSDDNHKQLKMLLGARKRDTNPRKHLFKTQPKFNGKPSNIPDQFDSRTQWPNCADVIGTIPDQSACGSCWAVSSASVMSDRVCIGSNGEVKTPISANDLISCCYSCGDGCDGGWPDETFYTWQSDGVVTGSGYLQDTGCSPYPFPVCEHHSPTKTKYPQCATDIYDTPKCSKKCQSSYSDKTYKQDKTFGQSPVFFTLDNENVQKEIQANGPVVFTFDVYEDFELYSGGIYQHTTGDYLGGHAVRCIGWGVENGTPYWLIANSWNEDWGEEGYFRIIRGQDDCGIEEEVSAGKYKQ